MRIDQFLSQSPIFQTNRIARRMDAALNQILAPEGLTGFEALVLSAIFFERRGAIKPSDLSATFQTTRGNVSHCLSSLEAKGLVRRRIDPDDARAFQLMVTPPGKAKAVRVVGILDRVQRELEATMGTEALAAMLERMNRTSALCDTLARR
ncbi:DNA-binding transcriptional regulator, MarR family [Granulicella rosea]|uniref:DNA-binding transcriptional regulator, MarR family n=1 Tax=Granulicella rosea TaxID=474952 RepID=A0A239DFL3_9BACT|nr:MarR family winged helix-turn-helix transcriptional regulator [Granulicella rosea]SNS31195.1 DNA-binding transcriptional regulator, MarR family [Granulicella rosea]